MLNRLSPVVKKLLIINVIIFFAYQLLATLNIRLNPLLSLYFFESDSFLPYQILSYSFMHAGILHLFFNMMMIAMFGVVLERIWGAQRFLFFYFTCVLGAALLHNGILYFEYQELTQEISALQLQRVIESGFSVLDSGNNYVDPVLGRLNILLNTPMLGASGGVFGIMVAFAFLFPNTELYLMFIPIPIKAKYAMGFMALAELFFGVANFSGDNIAHFAHLGGALFGFILLLLWKQNKQQFY